MDEQLITRHFDTLAEARQFYARDALKAVARLRTNTTLSDADFAAEIEKLLPYLPNGKD